MSSQSHTPSQETPPGDNRRSFFAVAAAVVTGAVAVLTPLAAGVASFLTPLFRKAKSSTVRVALLDQIPDDGVPRSFPVLADRVDAWTRYPRQRIGAVYLVRNKGEATPTAFTAKCPHAGCFIGYTPGEETFKCPCHTSAFKLDGARARGDDEVSPRDMDKLKVEVRSVAGAERAGIDEVWIEFVDFQTGHKERIPTT
jgi:menaquinol-cytochrome c reductase iron-sulfur subunit